MTLTVKFQSLASNISKPAPVGQYLQAKHFKQVFIDAFVFKVSDLTLKQIS
jgi:hypothetical protein